MHAAQLAKVPLYPMILALLLAFGACQGDIEPASKEVARVPAFDAARAWALLQKQVELGPRSAGSEAGRQTRELLVAELTSYGLSPVREPFKAQTPVGELEMENIYADLEGPVGPKGEPAAMIVLGSHFDTKRLPFRFVGANDGASSTAVLLELARVLAAGPTPPATYRFVFFDGEEALRRDWVDPDNRYGSTLHVKRLDRRKGLRKRLKAMILLDMIGDANLQLEYDSSSTRRLLEIFVNAARQMGDPELFSRRPYAIEDDHEPFIRKGIPALDLIDLHYGALDNEYWHQALDTPEHCSERSLERVGQLVLRALPAVVEAYVR